MTSPFPPFDAHVPRDGYRWWYVDAVSPDGGQALTLIAFVGSVFSPWYARARRRGPADPAAHCSLNAVLYGQRGKYWTFTERPPARVRRSAGELQIGPSTVCRDGDSLRFEIDEVTVPLPGRLRGHVTVTPEFVVERVHPLDGDHQHYWRPIAPRARVDVDLTAPATRWSGEGYLDSNWGGDALERTFTGWNWSRMTLGARQDKTVVLYDVVRRDHARQGLALCFGEDGSTRSIDPPDEIELPRTSWRVSRRTRSERTSSAGVVRTLEDTPFYARSLVQTRLQGETATGVHESLSLTRFASPWVQWMLPFRAPRW